MRSSLLGLCCALLREGSPAAAVGERGAAPPALRRQAPESLAQANASAQYRYPDGYDTAEGSPDLQAGNPVERHRGPAPARPLPPATSSADPADRVAVVANLHHSWDLGWLQRRKIRVEEVNVCDHVDWFDPQHLCGQRSIGESLAWLEWIVLNYDTLPAYVAFLHGPEVSWHTSDAGIAERVQSSTPEEAEMLADSSCLWTEAAGHDVYTGHEGPGVDAIYLSLWGTPFLDAWHRWDMPLSYKCCAEAVVSRAAIRSKPRAIYEELLALIQRQPEQPWAWIFERAWQNLWEKPLAFPPDQVVQRLRAQKWAHTKTHGYAPAQAQRGAAPFPAGTDPALHLAHGGGRVTPAAARQLDATTQLDRAVAAMRTCGAPIGDAGKYESPQPLVAPAAKRERAQHGER